MHLERVLLDDALDGQPVRRELAEVEDEDAELPLAADGEVVGARNPALDDDDADRLLEPGRLGVGVGDEHGVRVEPGPLLGRDEAVAAVVHPHRLEGRVRSQEDADAGGGPVQRLDVADHRLSQGQLAVAVVEQEAALVHVGHVDTLRDEGATSDQPRGRAGAGEGDVAQQRRFPDDELGDLYDRLASPGHEHDVVRAAADDAHRARQRDARGVGPRRERDDPARGGRRQALGEGIEGCALGPITRGAGCGVDEDGGRAGIDVAIGAVATLGGVGHAVVGVEQEAGRTPRRRQADLGARVAVCARLLAGPAAPGLDGVAERVPGCCIAPPAPVVVGDGA